MPSQAYVFAHQAIPSEAFKDPGRFLSIVNGPDANQYMADLWAHAGKYGDPVASQVGLAPRAEIRGTGNGLIALVFMPPPLDVAEAHIVGLFAKFASQASPSLDQLAWHRLFTLEHSVDPTTQQPMTMLCEWTPDGTHRNLGGGPVADERPFVEAVFEVLRQEATSGN